MNVDGHCNSSWSCHITFYATIVPINQFPLCIYDTLITEFANVLRGLLVMFIAAAEVDGMHVIVGIYLHQFPHYSCVDVRCVNAHSESNLNY